jgi:predicted DNA-binding transcriptional regulator YafY
MTVEKLAEKCGVSKRTIQRDFVAIQNESLFPLSGKADPVTA